MISPVSSPDRRTVLRSGLAMAALGAVGAATGCTSGPKAAALTRHRLIGPDSPQVAAAEAARQAAGTVQAGVAPEAGHVDLGGPVVATWSYAGQIPGPEIRVRKGQVVQPLLVNRLPAETTVHWHGVAIRNNMDGVPGMTQPPVPAGEQFTYRFAVAQAGTYWYHPHVGVQLDSGLYGPLIVEDPDEPVSWDLDWTVVLDDWIDGTGYTPGQVLDALRGGMGGMSMARSGPSPVLSAARGGSPGRTGRSARLLRPAAGGAAGPAGGAGAGRDLPAAADRRDGPMYHPMHIHGHTFQLGPAGPRKDTVIVRPGEQVACDFDAANPGQWMTHCHNLYHAPGNGGMMALLGYQS